MEGGRVVFRRSENRNIYSLMVAKPDGKRSLGKPRRRRQTIKSGSEINRVAGLICLRIRNSGRT